MFTPHHHFANCERLEREIAAVQRGGNARDDIYEGYKLYHFALIHKLKSARDCLTKLEQSMAAASSQDLANNPVEFLYTVNCCIDGFFYAGGSAMDILAREVLTYYGVRLPANVYFRTARKQLQRTHPNHALLPRLSDPPWLSEFQDYRNALTHEVLILAHLSFTCDIDGPDQKLRVLVPLPDNPRERNNQRTYKRNEDVCAYCTTAFKRILSFVNQVYEDLVTGVRTARSLPI
jgi:hypothetical protein